MYKNVGSNKPKKLSPQEHLEALIEAEVPKQLPLTFEQSQRLICLLTPCAQATRGR